MIDLDAIERRDAELVPSEDPMWVKYSDPSEIDRRALLAYVRELIAAARKVTCARCAGTGLCREPIRTLGIVYRDVDCPDCADLRALLPEVKP